MIERNALNAGNLEKSSRFALGPHFFLQICFFFNRVKSLEMISPIRGKDQLQMLH